MAGPLNPAGAGSPGPNGTGKTIAGETTAGDGVKNPLTTIGKTATMMTPTVRRMTWKVTTQKSTGAMSPRPPWFMAIADGAMSPATAHSQLRSGQEARRLVMFVKRSVEPSPEATTGTATDDSHLTQLQRLEVIIDLLESLARSGLPTLINSFQRSGDFTKLRTVCQARLQTRPRWFHQYQRLVSLVDALMATCTQATYDAMKWKINPAEFMHVVRVKEGAEAPAPGEAGDGHLRELLRGTAAGSNDPPVMDEAGNSCAGSACKEPVP